MTELVRELINKLLDGKRIYLPNGQVIGMGEDFSIGYMYMTQSGEWFVGAITIDLTGLVQVIEKYNLSLDNVR